MRILITGGAGYIGSNLIKRLGKRFHFARPERVEWVNYDIRKNRRDDILNLARLKKAVRGTDGILHLAAIARPKWCFENPKVCLETNILGTINVLEAVRQVNPGAWIIFGSSREVFGNPSHFPVGDKTPRAPLNAYAVSKVAGEDLARQYAKNYGLRCLTVRFCGVYTGGGDILDRVIPKFIGQALRGLPITIEGDGKEKKFDFVYIDDIVEALRRAIYFIAKKEKGFYDDLTLSVNNPVSLYDLSRMIRRLTGSKSRIINLPERSYDVKGFWGKNDKAKRLLGWKPKVSLEEGIRRSIEELKPVFLKKRYSR